MEQLCFEFVEEDRRREVPVEERIDAIVELFVKNEFEIDDELRLGVDLRWVLCESMKRGLLEFDEIPGVLRCQRENREEWRHQLWCYDFELRDSNIYPLPCKNEERNEKMELKIEDVKECAPEREQDKNNDRMMMPSTGWRESLSQGVVMLRGALKKKRMRLCADNVDAANAGDYRKMKDAVDAIGKVDQVSVKLQRLVELLREIEDEVDALGGLPIDEANRVEDESTDMESNGNDGDESMREREPEAVAADTDESGEDELSDDENEADFDGSRYDDVGYTDEDYYALNVLKRMRETKPDNRLIEKAFNFARRFYDGDKIEESESMVLSVSCRLGENLEYVQFEFWSDVLEICEGGSVYTPGAGHDSCSGGRWSLSKNGHATGDEGIADVVEWMLEDENVRISIEE